MTLLVVSFFLIAISYAYGSSQQFPPLPTHPRLILTTDKIKQLKTIIKTEAEAESYYKYLIEHADWIVTQPVIPEPPSGPSGVLVQVRWSLDYILTTTLAFILSENTTYFDRALKEANNLAVTWRDWNAAHHFLDTGEAATAIGLFIDWAYDHLDASQKSALVNGMITKGMDPYRDAYAKHSQFWINSTINWNCVCAGGGIIASLAIVDEPGVPTWIWSDVYTPSILSIPKCIGAYGEEGSWMEGVGYWGYASKYNIFAITAIQTSLGNSVASPLYSIPGVSRAGTFPLYMTGGSGQIFDWADGETGQVFAPFMQWFGTTFKDTASSWWGKSISAKDNPGTTKSNQWGYHAENLIYYFPGGSFSDVTALPLSFAYPSRALAAVRSAWAGPIGGPEINSFHIKGGDNAWNHAHLDLGSWVFDRQGVRFVSDLGADNYALPDYFGPTRWQWYRLNTHGHNSLRFDGVDQNVAATATLTLKKAFGSAGNIPMAPQDSTITVDLSAAYAHQGVTRAVRGVVTMSNVSSVVFREEITAPSTLKNLTWSLHTFTSVKISTNNQTAVLSSGTRSVTITIIPTSGGSKCPDAKLVATSIDLLPPQYSSKGLTRLDIVSNTPGSCTVLAVQIGDPYSPELVLRPILEWGLYGPFDILKMIN